MAPKDYVSRGQAKTSQAPSRPPFPWVRFVITLLLIVGFVVFLWYIREDNADKVITPQNKPQKQELTLPDAPEEQWEYLKLLPDPNTTVEVDVPQQQKSDKTYVMQCGSFRKKAQAEAMRANIAFQGLESQVKTTNGKNGVWHRVVLGPYESKRQGERNRHKLQKASITTCRIW